MTDVIKVVIVGPGVDERQELDVTGLALVYTDAATGETRYLAKGLVLPKPDLTGLQLLGMQAIAKIMGRFS